MKRLVMIAAAALLGGCATIHSKAPTLGHGDTTGFDARGASVRVQYEFVTSEYTGVSGVPVADPAPAEVARLRDERAGEVYSLLQGYGFRAVSEGGADYTVRVVERSERSDPDSIGLMMLGSFSMLMIPSPWTATRDYQYELWSGGNKVHGVDTKTEKKQLFGLIGIPLMLVNAGGSVDRKARSDAHDSVLSTWIEQGSFE